MNGRSYPRKTGASGFNVVLGIWLIISPFVLGFVQNQAAKWTDIGTGIAVVLLALRGGSWWNFILGIWLIISPFVLGFANSPTLLWNNVVLGILVGIIAWLGNAGRVSETDVPPTL